MAWYSQWIQEGRNCRAGVVFGDCSAACRGRRFWSTLPADGFAVVLVVADLLRQKESGLARSALPCHGAATFPYYLIRGFHLRGDC